jgi:hypothetical protein
LIAIYSACPRLSRDRRQGRRANPYLVTRLVHHACRSWRGSTRVTISASACAVNGTKSRRPICSSGEQALQKCRIGRKLISLQFKTKVLLITVAGRSSMDHLIAGRIANMVIETVLFIAFAVSVGAAIVKAFERSQDVLHGPYMKRVD